MIRPLLALSLLLGTVSASELREERHDRLAAKLAPEGLSGRLAEALKTEWGRKAFDERIEVLRAAPLARARRDAQGLWEEHYFTPDAAGRLDLRPEREAEFERLVARKPLAVARFDKFSRRLDEVGDRIHEETDLDKAAKEGWKERGWRLGMFNYYVGGRLADADLDIDQVLDTRLLLWLVPGPQGKLQVSEPGSRPIATLINEVYAMSDEVKKYERAYLKLVAKSDPETAKAASVEDVVTLTCLKFSEDIKPAGVDPLSTLLDIDPKAVVKDAEPVIREAARLKFRIDAIADAVSDDNVRSSDLKLFLSDVHLRVLLVKRLTPTEATATAQSDYYFNAIMPAQWCDDRDGKLVFKRRLFRNQSGESTLKGFRAHLNDAWQNQFRSLQQLFLSTAERCADAKIAAFLRDPDVLMLLRQDEARIGEMRSVAIQDGSLDAFLKLYFTAQDGGHVVRPECAATIEALLARAEQLKPKN
jgi:hypothetical protein